MPSGYQSLHLAQKHLHITPDSTRLLLRCGSLIAFASAIALPAVLIVCHGARTKLVWILLFASMLAAIVFGILALVGSFMLETVGRLRFVHWGMVAVFVVNLAAGVSIIFTLFGTLYEVAFVAYCQAYNNPYITDCEGQLTTLHFVVPVITLVLPISGSILLYYLHLYLTHPITGYHLTLDSDYNLVPENWHVPVTEYAEQSEATDDDSSSFPEYEMTRRKHKRGRKGEKKREEKSVPKVRKSRSDKKRQSDFVLTDQGGVMGAYDRV